MVKLSEEEVQQIEEKIKEGFVYAAKDEISFGIVGLFREKPERIKFPLGSGDSNVFYSENSKIELTLDEFYHKFVMYENSPVYLPDVAEKQKEMIEENMNAVEFLEKFKEICKSENCKGKCPFDDDEQGCSFHTDSVEVIIEKVKGWNGKQDKTVFGKGGIVMDIAVFLKQMERMCKSNAKCSECDAYKSCVFKQGLLCDFERFVEIVENWSKQHPEIVLTEQQKTAIRGRIAEGAKWIARDGCGSLCIYTGKPDRHRTMFDSREYDYEEIDSSFDIYDFVKWQNSPINLQSLLDNQPE